MCTSSEPVALDPCLPGVPPSLALPSSRSLKLTVPSSMPVATYHVRARYLFSPFIHPYHNPHLAFFAVTRLSCDFSSDVLASRTTIVWPTLQYIPCLNVKIVRLPDSAECDMPLLRSLFNRLTWASFIVGFHLGILRAPPHHRPGLPRLFCVLCSWSPDAWLTIATVYLASRRSIWTHISVRLVVPWPLP